MRIRTDQMDGDLLKKAGFDMHEVWSANSRSNLAKRARRALLVFPEGKAHVEEVERMNREASSQEWKELKSLSKWAERFGKTPPSIETLRATDTHMDAREMVIESFLDAIKESATEEFPELPLPEKDMPFVSEETIHFCGLVGSWDGYDTVWGRDEEQIRRWEKYYAERRAEEKREAEKREAERGAPHHKHDWGNHHGWS